MSVEKLNNKLLNQLSADLVDFEVCLELVKQGADVDLSSVSGNSLIIKACLHGKVDPIKELIKLGANLDVIGRMGSTPLSIVIRGRYPDLARILIKAGADVNIRDAEGNTPLMETVHYDEPEITALLLASGADTSLTNNDGESALDIAIRGGCDAVAWIIKDFIKKAEEKNSESRTDVVSSAFGLGR